MQFITVITAICLALVSGTIAAEITPIMNATPALTPSQSASPSFTRSIRVPASRSVTPTVAPTHPYLKRSATAASSERVLSTPVAPSGFRTSTIPTSASGFKTSAVPSASRAAGSADILGSLLNLPQQ